VGMTASAAMLLYQAYEGGPKGLGSVYAQETELVKRLWPLEEMALETWEMWHLLDGKSFVNLSRFASNPYHQNQDIIWKEECEQAGMTYAMLDSAIDPAKEVENMDLAISRKFDVIMGGPLDPAGASPGIKRARQAGQIVMNFDTDSIQRPTMAHGRILWSDGWLAAKWLSEKLPAGAKVVGGVGEQVSNAGIDRKAGFLKGVSDFGLELVYFEDNNGWTDESSYIVGGPLLQNYPDIQGVFFGNDSASLGFSKAALDAGRREEMLIVGADGLREGQEAIADGRLDAGAMMFWGQGPETVQAWEYAVSMLRAGLNGDAMESAHIIESIVADKDTIAAQWQSPV